jgi:uncharacterized membrane protein
MSPRRTSESVLPGLLRILAAYLLLNMGVFLMLKLIVAYSNFDERVGFLEFKQDYLHITAWKIAFYIHVFSSIFTLLAGLTQFSPDILKNHRRIHRFMGRIYAWDIIAVNFPAGLVMAFYANGHWPSKLAFLILDCLWFWFTLRAVTAIKKGDVVRHREYMIRSYALTFSAVTLRTWRMVLSSTLNLDPQLLYMLDAWLGFVPNLLCAEWLISRGRAARSAMENAGKKEGKCQREGDGEE